MAQGESIGDLIAELKQLNLREGEVIELIEAANQRQTKRESAPIDAGTSKFGTFRVGDRVVVTNKIRKPTNHSQHWTPEKERRAVVTGIDGDKVHIKTNNGVETWRLSKKSEEGK